VQVYGRRQVNPLTIDEFFPNPDAVVPLQRLKEAGLILIATTSQPGLSQGYPSRLELERMHKILKSEFGLNAIYVCPHDLADDCPCRKPRPALFLEAAYRWRLDLDRSYVVSDKWQDAMAAHYLGCTSLLVASPWIGSGHHDFVLPSLAEAVNKLLQLHYKSHSLVRCA
jgi:D-glycero-D-manno-heptose 1,7-bisphosphate phosphatase